MKRLAIAVAVGTAIGVMSPVSQSPADAHTQCAHLNEALGGPSASSAWWENWWIGYNTAGTMFCHLNGNFTVGIQRINWHMGYRQSSVDGKYGGLTHQDVRSYQAFSGFSVDGLVGHGTWYSYGTRAKQCGYNGSFDLYRIGSCSGPITFARDIATNPTIWYVAGLSNTWQRFWKWGPS